MNVLECLPEHLRAAEPQLTRLPEGWSGASVYRVEVGDETFLLKVVKSPDDEWLARARIQQAAASAGIAPPVVHVEPRHQAILSAFVEDRSYRALLANEETREQAVDMLGVTLRHLHALPTTSQTPRANPMRNLTSVWPPRHPVPAWAVEAVDKVIAEPPPPTDRPEALCHNDVNPTNLLFDGHRVLLVDWDVTGLNDPLWDLAAAAVFMRFDEATSLRLLSAHDGRAVTSVPLRFVYQQRLVAALCGATGLYGPVAGDPTRITLTEVYQAYREGSLNLATPAGAWKFGLAMLDDCARRSAQACN
jgi:aminoglycoside phosphotransferase (APT) family kinase protein